VSLRSFLLDAKHTTRSGFVWNTMSSGLYALQSLVMLIVTQRVLGQNTAGILAIGQAIAFLLGCVGTFGVARFQASDVKHRFTFAEYVTARAGTIAAMWLIGAIVLALRHTAYGDVKVTVIALMTLLKTVDVMDDVVFGFFQQRGRIDIGARQTTIRYSTTLVAFVIAVIATHNLVISLVIALVAGLCAFGLLISQTLPGFVTDDERQHHWRDTAKLLTACLPLFVAWFLSSYINNAPKYAIDAVADDATQAIYGFLVTPAFVVSLIAQFMFNPLIFHYSTAWVAGRTQELRRRMWRMLAAIFGIGLATCLIGYFIGLPVLSWIYGLDLRRYLAIFMVLLAAGTTTAVSMFLYTVLTIMRQQATLAIGYATVSVVALFGGKPLVRGYGLMGAAGLYIGLTGILSVAFLLIALIKMATASPASPTPLPSQDSRQNGEPSPTPTQQVTPEQQQCHGQPQTG